MERPVLFIADADPAEREGLAGALERRFGADYEVTTAAAGTAALDALASQEIVTGYIGFDATETCEFAPPTA